MHHNSALETLPNLALANIFCRTSIKDRSHNIPFVCRSWAHAISHPHCWASMVAENYSPFGNSAADRAFVRDSYPNGVTFVDPFDGWRSPCPCRGVASLLGLIGRAGAGAVVTSVYFFPFLTSAVGPANDDALLGLIAKHCPNLKHLSFHGSHNASQEAMLEVIHSCTKLELVDFFDSPYFNSLILGELSCCCPNIRGIRRNGYLEPLFSKSLITGFPRLKTLNISNSTVVDKDLLAIVTGFKELCYLDVTGCQQLICYMHIIKDLVLHLDILRKLDKHRGCVNTVNFNAAGDILVSGSDDKRIILWDWETGQVKLSFHSGHDNNVFQAKIMPYTEDRSIVTCAADGQVRHAQILECGVETKLLAEHHGRAHKLAVEPGSPHIFYSCGEDGLVQHIDLRTGSATRLFTCKPIPGQTYFSTVNLNAITIDPRNPNLFAVGGSDQFARLFDIRQYNWDGSSEFGQPVELFCPPHLIDDDNVGITGLAFSEQSELLVSYNDEFIYLFTKDIGLGPEPTFTSQVSDGSDPDDMTPDINPGLSYSHAGDDVKAAPQVYKGHKNCETVKGVSFFGPKCEYVVSGSDCGRIFIWKKKGGELVRVMEADKHIVNCIEAHPHATVLASSGIEHDIKMWIPKAIERATLPTNIQKRRPRREGWMHRMVSPEDLLMLQVFSRQRWRRTSPESSGDVGINLLQLLLTFDAANSDDGGDNTIGAEDCYV